MRLAVLADIHGNLPALEAVLTKVQQQNVDGIILAGDYLSDGPNPIEVLRLLQLLDNTWMIRGNTDNRILAYDSGDLPAALYTSKQWAGWRWLHNSLDRKMLDFIASLPEQCVVTLDDTAPIRVVHGSPQSPSEHLFPDRDLVSLSLFRKAGLIPPDSDPVKLEVTLAQINEPVLVCAHSHIPWKQKQKSGSLVFNPGAVGEPIGSTCAQYALLTWEDNRWQVKHEVTPYDLDRVRTAYKKSGLLTEENAFTRAVLLGMETGQNVAGHFLSHVFSLAQEAGCEECDVFPDEIWEHAITTFDWEPAAWKATV